MSWPPRAASHATIAAPMSPLVERRGALGPEALDRVGEVGVAERLALAQHAAAGREHRARLGRAERGSAARISKMYACSALSGTPARASAAAGAARSAAGIEPQRSIAAARPGGRAVGRRTTPAPTLKTCAASPKDTSTGRRSARSRRVGAAAGRLDEEVEQRRLLARARDEHVAARARAGEQRLGDPRREHGRDRGVDRVAALAQHAGAGLRGDRVAGGDDAASRLALTRRMMARPPRRRRLPRPVERRGRQPGVQGLRGRRLERERRAATAT